MYKVFVSHKTEELSILEELVNSLNRVGFDVYIAERLPWPGDYLYDQKIIPAIANSDCMLVLLTLNSASSPDVNQEIGIARSHNKPIVALVENGVQIKGLLVGREVFYFDRYDTLPTLQNAFEHLQNRAAIKEKAKSDQNTALLMGAVLFTILVLSSKSS
jgi:hypothetical protein